MTGSGFNALKTIGLNLSGDVIKDKEILNEYLDSVDEQLDLSKFEQRLSKKQRLLDLAPAAFTSQYADIFLDSDNSFGDVLLADSYLKLMGVEGIFSNERII